MRKCIRLLLLVGVMASLAVPALAQSNAPVKKPRIDHAKVYLLEQEYVVATAEMRGKIAAKRAELELLLATKPDDAAKIKKVISEIGALQVTLLEKVTQFRLRLAKEANMPIAFTRRFGLSRGGAFHGKKGMRPPRPPYRGPAMAPGNMPPAPAGETQTPPAK